MTEENKAAVKEPAPERGGRSCTIMAVEYLVKYYKPGDWMFSLILDLAARDEMGFKKYGQNLETWDGRDTLNDLYQELLDAYQYAVKAVAEALDVQPPFCPDPPVRARLIDDLKRVKHELVPLLVGVRSLREAWKEGVMPSINPEDLEVQ